VESAASKARLKFGDRGDPNKTPRDPPDSFGKKGKKRGKFPSSFFMLGLFSD
jgi:hypothetical protein